MTGGLAEANRLTSEFYRVEYALSEGGQVEPKHEAGTARHSVRAVCALELVGAHGVTRPPPSLKHYRVEPSHRTGFVNFTAMTSTTAAKDLDRPL